MINKATMPRMHWKLLEQCPPYPIIAKKATQDFLIRDSGSVGRVVASDPEVRGSNPVIGKNLYRTFTFSCFEKTKIKKKRPEMAHLKKSF